MQKIITVIVIIILLAGVACSRINGTANDITFEESGKSDGSEIDLNAKSYELSTSPVKAVIITDINGRINDAAYIQSAWNGLNIAGEELGVQINYKSPSSSDEYTNIVNEAINEGASVIFAYGEDLADFIESAASQNEFCYFVLLDFNNTGKELKNLKYVDFSEEGLGFLAGYFAALETKSGNIGFLGTDENDSFIKELKAGFDFGVSESHVNANVYYEFCNSSEDEAVEKMKALEKNGCDIVFAPVGGFSAAVVDEAKAVKIIGCDVNQSYLSEEKVIASAIRHFDVACYNIIKDVMQGSFKEGENIEGSVTDGYLEFEITAEVGTDIKNSIAEVEEAISNGRVNIPKS
ncbi:MAG: BMP family ABC transporter substrate-binding protein [Lachnospiraceae bacterium]|nr:BMP family ABC transporter substrate-binding protein [Lachnospiraceae bacterium]